MKRTIEVPCVANTQTVVDLSSDCNAVFVLGANGSGKSALLHHLTQRHQEERPDGQMAVHRVTAHRQTWFDSNRPSMAGEEYKNEKAAILRKEANPASRYKEDYAGRRVYHALHSLLQAERRRLELIGTYYEDSKETNISVDRADTYMKNHASPLKTLNQLFRAAALDIEVRIPTTDREALVAHNRTSSATYGVEQLSDGERSALLLASQVLTAPSGTLLIVDEPERHLHRSIASPLLAGLFAAKRDCHFVVSTHEITLPQDCPGAHVLLLRSCTFADGRAVTWDVDKLAPSADIPEEIRSDVWGARRTLVFVEGEPHSLDRRVYEAIFPGVSFVSKGSWRQIVRAVEAASTSRDLHWLSVYGLIDRDRHSDDESETIARRSVYSLDCYAVESIYYAPEIQRAVGRSRVEETGGDIDQVLEDIRSAVLRDAATLSEHATVSDDRLCHDIDNCNVDSIIANYPIKRSRIPHTIATRLQFRTSQLYQQAVIIKLREDDDLRRYAADMCGGLQRVLTEEDSPLTIHRMRV